MFQQKKSKTDAPSKVAVIELDPEMGMPINECLKALASKWHERQTVLVAESTYDADNLINSPEILQSYAAQLNINLQFAPRRLSGFMPKKFPCIYILKNGLGVIATSADRRGIKLYIDGLSIIASKRSIQKETEKTAIFPSPLAGTQDADEPVRQEANNPGSTIRTSFSWLFSEIFKGHKSTLSLMFIAAFMSNMLMIALPLFIMSVYDRVIPNNALETLWALSIGVMIALGVDLGIRRIRIKLADAVSLATSVSIQAKLIKVLTRTKLESMPRNSAAWTNSFKDVDTATSVAPALMSAILVDIPFVFLVLLLIYSIAGPTVMAPVVGIAVFALWTLFAQFKLARIGEKDSITLNAKTETLNETASHIKTIKATNSLELRTTILGQLLEKSIPSTHALRLQAGMQTQTTMIMVQIVIVMAIIIGVHQISSGSMTIGALAATTLLVGRVLLPAGNVLMLSAKVGQISRSIAHIHSLLQLPQEEMTNKREQQAIKKGEIEFRNVGFSFENASKPILNDVSFSISSGERIAIIGKSGSGKSTLMQLICRLYDPTVGSFIIDQFDSRQFSHSEVRNNLAYMPQDSELFDTNIYENLKVANPDASHEEILQALSTAGAGEFIQSNQEGLSFEVGRRGEKLSGGERQSIALARALLRPGKMLLLDEPTSSMDNTTEANVIDGIQNTIGNKTLIISTHRANVLSVVDRIIWMDKGRIIADGPREEIFTLLKKAA